MDRTTVKAVVEAVIFAAEEPVSLKQLFEILGVDEDRLGEVLAELDKDCETEARGLRLRSVAGGYRFVTRPDYHPWIKLLFTNQRSVRLSRAALETLAIVAYKQPITSPEIEAIRGVDASNLLKGLLDKRLLKVLGRKEVVGRPLLYGTTREFLMQFGLKELADLPRLEEFEELIDANLDAEPEPQARPVTESSAPQRESEE